MLKVLLGAAIGFAAAWFLDPDAGEGRRKTMQEKATSYVRKSGPAEETGDPAAHVAGTTQSDLPPTSEPAAAEPMPAAARPAEEAVPGAQESFLRPRR